MKIIKPDVGTPKIHTAFIPFTLDINDELVSLRINASTSNLGAFSRTCKENAARLEPLEAARNEAIEAGDHALVVELNGKMAAYIEPILVMSLGETGYGKLMTALGAGERASLADCIEPSVEVMQAIHRKLAEHFGWSDMSAAQMTAGAADALQTPDGD